jgi:hypothetical protein
MRLGGSRHVTMFAAACGAACLGVWMQAAAHAAGDRGFDTHGTSTSRVVSPAVVASWVSHDDSLLRRPLTLLVLWRGTPGWFSKGRRNDASGMAAGSGSSLGTGASQAYAYEYVSRGGLTFTMAFDYDRRIVKILDQQISLAETNVMLIDFVDSSPAVVGRRWVDPPAPSADAALDPIIAVIKRAPDLFDYLRCDLSLPDPRENALMPVLCAQVRP